MQIGSLARRYARALFELGIEAGGDPVLDRWLEQLQRAGTIFRDTGLYPILENPGIQFEEKRQILGNALPGIDTFVRNFLYLIVSKNRIRLLDQMIAAFQTGLYERRGIAVVDVRTAIPLTDDQRQRLTTRLGNFLKKSIIVREEIDPSIVGGAVIIAGDKLIDASVLGRLDALHDQLLQLY